MARGNDPGKDFDDQYRESKRRGRDRASRGEGAWADDKYLERVNARLSGPPARHRGEPSKSCLDKTVMLLALLTGILWAVSYTVQHAL
jgi:hypothetical protein